MFIFFVVAAGLFLVFASIHLLCTWSAHKSLAPRTRTLLGVLGQATLIFVAVATLLFFFFCECPKFCDLAKQRRKIFVGVSEVRKIDFALLFFWLCVFFLVFFFCCDRATIRGWRAMACRPGVAPGICDGAPVLGKHGCWSRGPTTRPPSGPPRRHQGAERGPTDPQPP